MKMRRAVLYRQEELRIEECPIPEIGDGEVLAAELAVGQGDIAIHLVVNNSGTAAGTGLDAAGGGDDGAAVCAGGEAAGVSLAT